MHFIRDFPEARTCPPDTLRALRAIDPATDVLYLGPTLRGGRWMVGTVHPSAQLRAAAANTIASLKRLPQRRRGIAWHRRYWLAQAQGQGFRPVAPYECVEPDGQMVADYQRADWLHRHTSTNEFLLEMDRAEDATKAAAHRDLTDAGRARDAWRYGFTRSHMPSAKLVSEPHVSSAITRTPLSAIAHPSPAPPC